MISILLPIYNYNSFPLVAKLHEQVVKTGIAFEIICFDDASTLFLSENEKINSLSNARYEALKTNIGRSKIRNLLAQTAQYHWLLFLDADVMPEHDSFVANYIPHLNDDIKIINGGITYQKQQPNKNQLLRWVYGKKREALSPEIRSKNPYLSLLTLNFLIHKSIFKKVRFNESIPNLRHEDTLFSFNLMQHNIPIVQIENPVCHLGLDDFETAIRKENESLIALKNLLEQDLLSPDYLKIAKYYTFIKQWRLRSLFSLFHSMSKSIFLRNLAGESPSLFIFDLYRLGYLCQLDPQ